MSDGIIPVSTSQEIETKKVNINKLFTDFWFRVPEYQRSYRWGPEEIDDLLDDIKHAQHTAKDKEYFLGSVVLQKYLRASGNLTYTCYDVLDGQQRLTTLLITMAVLRDLATDAKLKNRAAEAIFQEENQYENQPERIRIEFLIRDEVGDFIEKFLKPEGGTKQEDLLRQRAELPNLSVSNMAKATLYLREWLSNLPPDELNRLAVFLFNKVIVIYVAAESLEDAFRLFTILNNRGLPLTNSDILKSMNVGAVMNEKKRRQYASLWEELEGEFGPDEFDRFLGHLRTTVVKEKARAICCYCLQRIRPTQDSMKIEHWHCQTQFPNEQLVYRNLLGACLGGQGQPPGQQHCDTRKGDLLLSRSPANPPDRVELLIRYNNGQIESLDAVFNQELNDVLNLNLGILQNNRKAVLDGFLQSLKNKKPHFTKVQLQRWIADWNGDAGGDRRPYCAVVVYWLRKKLAKM